MYPRRKSAPSVGGPNGFFWPKNKPDDEDEKYYNITFYKERGAMKSSIISEEKTWEPEDITLRNDHVPKRRRLVEKSYMEMYLRENRMFPPPSLTNQTGKERTTISGSNFEDDLSSSSSEWSPIPEAAIGKKSGHEDEPSTDTYGAGDSVIAIPESTTDDNQDASSDIEFDEKEFELTNEEEADVKATFDKIMQDVFGNA